MTPETFRVLRGNPTPEELAAALAVVQARAMGAPGAPDPTARRRTNEWASRSRALAAQRPPAPGPTSWRTSYWPS
ncbi:acyl-CoA carboxylase subunit epsilon [Streptomyces sp. A7024]|uniref:Acyl-CoA carboxylase subunit epsilon n=2 Tax=Streptomyces coryli TaxID=1128680 RepID=A0A6G4U9L5_9ACTN|nr:acyl-CoA carboxylase subunit epsilon [Streptomyces coryli]